MSKLSKVARIAIKGIVALAGVLVATTITKPLGEEVADAIVPDDNNDYTVD